MTNKKNNGGGKRWYLAIDIGAGNGTKIALFDRELTVRHKAHFHVAEYGTDFDRFLEKLIDAVDRFLADHGGTGRASVYSIGIACPGIFNAEGEFLLLGNLPQFIGHNLRLSLQEHYGVPVAIENDANAGALAEWKIYRIELLFWVFGGGWGGAWISADGDVRFPSTEYDGTDRSLHYTNEPGHTIPLEKLMLKTLFYEVSASFDRFQRVVLEEYKGDESALIGPNGDPDTIRAERILSGPGRFRLFKTIVGDDDHYERFLELDESAQMTDATVAGRHISKLSSMRVEAAINTDRLYGKILARATRTMIRAARREGMPANIPICLGGKPSYALPYFGPSAQRAMGRLGLINYLRPSVIDERGLDANVMGAAVLAEKILALSGA